MVNYSNGKIYKIEPITEHDEGDIYIGSTTKQYLSQRMDKHRSSYKGWKINKTKKMMSYDLFDKYDVNNCQIVLLEIVNANSKDELQAREKHYIKLLNCVNKYVPMRTKQEYKDDNKVKILEYQKQYKIDNREKMLTWHKQNYIDKK